MKLAYLVSRFPTSSETFVLRELDAVAADERLQVQLHSLFPAPDEPAQPDALAWIPRLRRPGPPQGLSGLAWWSARRPLRLLSSLGLVLRGYARRPRVLVRALASVLLALAHARELHEDHVEHVHAHFATYPALSAWLSWRLTGIPYSFTAHAHDIFIHQSMLARRTADAKFVVAISDFHRRFLLALAPSARVEIVHCGVHPDRLSPHEGQLPETGPVRALCVAGLREYKGHRILLRAIAGGGPPLDRVELDLIGDGELREEIERLVADLGLQDRVRLQGWLLEPEVAGRLAAADLFVLPSVVTADGDMEGVPVALMEALACALPTVATHQSGIPELVRDGETGWLAEPGDVDDLRRVLREVLEDPAQSAARGLAGRRLVEREFNQARSARRLADLFTEESG